MPTRRKFLQACGALAALPFAVRRSNDQRRRAPAVLWKWRTDPPGYKEPLPSER